MDVEYILQPDLQLGLVLLELLESEPIPAKIVFISAFNDLQTVVRFRNRIIRARELGSEISFVVGIEFAGTSRQVLEEFLDWGIDSFVIRNRIRGHTFHPKMYYFEWEDRAELIVGSNNLTEGGMFKNYEVASRTIFFLPEEQQILGTALAQVNRFINPAGPIVRPLTGDYLESLVNRNEILGESEARRQRSQQIRRRQVDNEAPLEPLFGVEQIPPPPPVPTDLQERLVRGVQNRRRRIQREDQGIPNVVGDVTNVIEPNAFYMTLPKLQGDNIPGEARIPLDALELDHNFWGWPDEYTRDEAPRGGINRVYFNWRPQWKISSVENIGEIFVQEVRMYLYANSSDFRFYSRQLVNLGADTNDIVRIRRIDETNATYECVLARQGTAEYETWLEYCSQPVRNSSRRYGYA